MPAIPAHLAKFAAKFHRPGEFDMPSGKAFPRISIGRERFTAIDAEGEETLLGLESFEFIVVAANPATSKIYFSSPYTGDEGIPPDCYSDNGYYPDVRAPNPQCESCALCHHNRWGSAKSNMTGKDIKACQDFKKLAIEPLHDDVTGVHFFRISPGALKNWSRYCNELRKIGGDCGFEVTPNLVVTKVYWAEKNVMGFEFVDFLDEELATFVEQVKEEKEFESWIGLDQLSQDQPMFVSSKHVAKLNGPEANPQKFESHKPEPIDVKPEEKPKVERGEPRRSATARRGLGAAKVAKDESLVPNKARTEALAMGAAQGEVKLSPIEVAKARARQQMGLNSRA